MSLRRRPCNFCTHQLFLRRRYSSAVNVTKTRPPKRKTSRGAPPQDVPPYPYGAAKWYKQRDRGLYGGASIQHGHSRTERKANKYDHVNLRVWHPNVQMKRLWSDALQEMVRVKVRMRVLRTIDKVGGLDNYLIGDKPARIKELGLHGWSLRWKVLNTKVMRQRREQERSALGLPKTRESAKNVKEGMTQDEALEKTRLGQLKAKARYYANAYVRMFEKKERKQKIPAAARQDTELEDDLDEPASVQDIDVAEEIVPPRRPLFDAAGNPIRVETSQSPVEPTGEVGSFGETPDLQIQRDGGDLTADHHTIESPSTPNSTLTLLEDSALLVPPHTLRAIHTNSAKALDDWIIHTAIAIRQDSRTLPLPPLYSSRTKRSLYLQYKATQADLPVPDFLLSRLDSLAPKLSTTTSDLLSAARDDIASRTARRAAQRAKKEAAQGPLAAAADSSPPVSKNAHREIDAAIISGSSTLLPLYEHYLTQSRQLVKTARTERLARRKKLANQHLRLLRTKKHKGGKGIYRKKSAWDTAFKAACKQLRKEESGAAKGRPTTWNTAPEELTLGQWRRLFLAAEAATKDPEGVGAGQVRIEEVDLSAEGKGRGREKQVYEDVDEDEDDDERKDPRSWMTEREVGMYNRITAALSGVAERMVSPLRRWREERQVGVVEKKAGVKISEVAREEGGAEGKEDGEVVDQDEKQASDKVDVGSEK